MDDEQVDVVGAQVRERGVEGAPSVVRQMPGVAQLAGDVDLVTRQAGGPQARSDATLVVVHLGRVDVPVPGLECSPDRLGCLLGRDQVGAVAELRDGVAVVEREVRDGVHARSIASARADGPTRPQIGDRRT